MKQLSYEEYEGIKKKIEKEMEEEFHPFEVLKIIVLFITLLSLYLKIFG